MADLFTVTEKTVYPVPGVLYSCTQRIYRFMGLPLWVSYLP